MLILEANRLSKNFGGLRALDSLDIEIEHGEIFGLIGPNGSGKTTLLNVTTGFLKPEVGDIKYKGKPIKGLQPYEIAARGIIRTFQVATTLSDLTAKENIIAGSYLKTNDTLWGSFFNTRGYKEQKAKMSQKANQVLTFLGMEERRNVLAGNLAPAEQRKLEIGIALAAEPELLLLDEPAAGLNAEECDELLKIVRSIQHEGATIIIVEHNMKVVMNLCTRIMVIDYGRKVAEGSPPEIAHNDEVISIYLGRDVHAKSK